MENLETFDIDEKQEEIQIKPLISDPYTYENIINNPIIKPISETDRNLWDIEEMLRKLLIDANNDKKFINQILIDAPEYGETVFVSRLIKLVQGTQNIIKLQDLKERNYKRCIVEMMEILKSNYGVRIDEKKSVVPETILPEGSYIKYLEKLSSSTDEIISEYSKKIIEIYNKEIETNLQKRYEISCTKVYAEEKDRKKKQMIAKILRMEV